MYSKLKNPKDLTLKNHITVIDSPTGSGKTSWAINYINEMADWNKVIFVTPFLDEVKRILDACPNIEIYEPKFTSEHKKKSDNFRYLVENNKNIVTSHKMLTDLADELVDLFKDKYYELILDETFQPVSPYNYIDDLKLKYKIPDSKKSEIMRNDMKTLEDIGQIQFLDFYLVNPVDKNTRPNPTPNKSENKPRKKAMTAANIVFKKL